MSRKLPPFAAVRAFEAAARHESFKKAAEELCLSPSAVSHQIRGLEEFLDTKLFERDGNTLCLTHTGRAYAGKLTHLLDGFEASTSEITRQDDRPIRILSTPGFAARWLVPRLDRSPMGSRVRLRVSVGAPSTDFATNDADLVVHWSDAPVPGVVVEPLMESARFPVAHPDYIAEHGIAHPRDLTKVTLMHDEVMDAWESWFRIADVVPPRMPRGPTFPNCELATTAAEQRQGVSLAYDAVVRGTLEAGRLVRLFDAVTMPFVIYSVAYAEHRAEDPMIRDFADWLHAESRAEGAAPADAPHSLAG
jgi:LysR family glycine cleavage system transcriptional activator